jgi:hypothetical protein
VGEPGIVWRARLDYVSGGRAWDCMACETGLREFPSVESIYRRIPTPNFVGLCGLVVTELSIRYSLRHGGGVLSLQLRQRHSRALIPVLKPGLVCVTHTGSQTWTHLCDSYQGARPGLRERWVSLGLYGMRDWIT